VYLKISRYIYTISRTQFDCQDEGIALSTHDAFIPCLRGIIGYHKIYYSRLYNMVETDGSMYRERERESARERLKEQY
jgi:hypothetical protein